MKQPNQILKLSKIELRTGSTSGPVIATTADITINDTSKTPAYTVPNIYPILSNVNEGSSFTIDVVTTNVADGTILYIQLAIMQETLVQQMVPLLSIVIQDRLL